LEESGGKPETETHQQNSNIIYTRAKWEQLEKDMIECAFKQTNV